MAIKEGDDAGGSKPKSRTYEKPDTTVKKALRPNNFCFKFRRSLYTDHELAEYNAKLRRNYVTKLLCFSLRLPLITDEELGERIQEMHDYCFSKNVGRSTKRQRANAFRTMNKILEDATRTQLQAQGPDAIIPHAISLLLDYEDDLDYENRWCEWSRRRRYRAAKICYYNLLRSFVPEETKSLVYTIIDTVQEMHLWHLEDLCFDLFHPLLEIEVECAIIAHAIWDKVEATTTSIENARTIVRVFYELLDVYDWPESGETIKAVERLLELYHRSVTVSFTEETPPYAPLRRGLEVCLRNTLKHLPNKLLLIAIRHMCSWSIEENANDDTILDFGGTLEYAASMHRSDLYEDTLTPEIFPLLMRMIASPSRLISLLGNRVMQCLIDRRNNRAQFDTPKIFFETAHFDLRMSRYKREDKAFLKNNREVLHDSLIRSMLTHASVRLNLETTYCTICLMAVEVPCGFTAAALVCLAMNLQDETLERKDMKREVTYHVHATVMSIMSLLCWIHRAKAFYAYVNKIMMERAQWAPHLNPPLQSRYSFAIHHVLWDKPELFFVNWEARYGLWKRFRVQGSRNNGGGTSDD